MLKTLKFAYASSVQFAQRVGNKSLAVVGATGALVGSLFSSNQAEAVVTLPTVITTAAGDITTYVQSMFDLFLPVVALGVGLGVVVALFKKYGKKAV